MRDHFYGQGTGNRTAFAGSGHPLQDQPELLRHHRLELDGLEPPARSRPAGGREQELALLPAARGDLVDAGLSSSGPPASAGGTCRRASATTTARSSTAASRCRTSPARTRPRSASPTSVGSPTPRARCPTTACTLELLNGVPNRVQVHASPQAFWEVSNNVGIFAQDQWKIDQADAEPRASATTTTTPTCRRRRCEPGPQVPGRNVSFDKVEDVPNWNDVSPRVGAAYDLFGNGRTALKVSIGRYVEAPNLTTFTRVANPANAIVPSAFRNWTRCQRRLRPAARRSSAPLSNTNFGQIDHHDALLGRGALDARLQLGSLDQRPARAGAARVGERRLLPPLVRQSARRPTTSR